MILSFDEVGDILDALAEQIPAPFYQNLNGGILLLPEVHTDPENPSRLYILGEYCVNMMGRYINLYYGSFAALYRNAPREVWEKELFATLRHEFTHHVEMLAGERGLERKDEARRMKFREELANDSSI